MNLWNTSPTPTQAKAFLGVQGQNVIFSFNPDDVKWSYKNNTISRDTIGGRVVQVLSSSIESMTVSGRAGSRERLQIFARDIKNLMQYQIQNNSAVNFKVPSRNWNFKVFIQNVSTLGWDVTSTAYPYQLNLMIQEDLTGIIGQQFREDAFLKLAKGIGYNPEYHGGNLDAALKYTEAMTNAINAINFNADTSSGIGTDGKYTPRQTGSGGNQTLANNLLSNINIDNVPIISNNIKLTIDEIYQLAYWALGKWGSLTGEALRQAAIIATAISCCETQSHDTKATNPNATNGTAYGLWQMNEGLGTSLYDPIIAALQMAKIYYVSKWRYWGCGPDHTKKYQDFMDEVRNVAQ